MKELDYKLNILPVDTPTINGRIYPKAVLEDALSEFFSKRDTMNIYRFKSDRGIEEQMQYDPKTRIASFDKSAISIEDGELTLNRLDFEDKEDSDIELINRLIQERLIEFGPFGIAELDEDRVITDFKFLGVHMYPNSYGAKTDAK